MTLDKFLTRAACAFCLLLAFSTNSIAQTQIVPTPPATGGAYVIAVVSDGYAKAEEWMFERAVRGLVLNGLMADSFFGNPKQQRAFTIYKIFKPVGSSGDSNFKIEPDYTVAEGCYLKYDPAQTTSLIEDAVKPLSPERIVVIGNHEGVSLGCRVDTWTYVSAGAREVGGILEHEFGHLIAGLDDEYPLTLGSQYTPPPNVDGPNCSNVQFVGGTASTPPEPSWMKIPRPVGVPKPNDPEGCRYVEKKIVRPYDHCRMRSAHAPFCFVCDFFMRDALAAFIPTAGLTRNSQAEIRILQAGFGFQPRPAQPAERPSGAPSQTVRAPDQTSRSPSPSPATPPGPPVPSVRVVVELTTTSADKATTHIVTMSDVTAPNVHRYRRTGDLVYAIVESGNILESGVVPGNPFQALNYGGTAAPHRVDKAPSTKASVVVTIPNTTRQQLLGRSFGVQFFQLSPASGKTDAAEREAVDPAVLKKMVGNKEAAPFAEVSPTELKKAAEQQPAQPPRGR